MNHTKEPCQYCEANDMFIVGDKEVVVTVEGYELWVEHEGNVSTGIINYCPKCGRKLVDV